MKIRITVTKKDLKDNNYYDTYGCPLYKAMGRKIKIKEVGGSTFNVHGDRRDFLIPENVANKVVMMGVMGKAKKTFSFTIDIPKKYFKERSVKR